MKYIYCYYFSCNVIISYLNNLDSSCDTAGQLKTDACMLIMTSSLYKILLPQLNLYFITICSLEVSMGNSPLPTGFGHPIPIPMKLYPSPSPSSYPYPSWV